MKTSKKKVSDLFAGRRANDAGGARLDLLLPRDWPQSETPLLWHWRPRVGEEQTGRGLLDELPNIGSAPVRVWTPATETLLTRTVLPTRSRAKVEQALPYALEEQLLDDPANLHFAWRREDDGSVFVAVTARERLRSWMAALTSAGLKPATLCPATLAVPWSPGCWSAAFVGDELLVRTGPVSGFTCAATHNEPPAMLVANLKEVQQGTQVPEYLIVFQPPTDFRAEAWNSTLKVPVRVEPRSFWQVPGDSEPALNLLQGAFAPKGELNKQLRPWIPAAVMLALALVGTIVFDGIEWWRLHGAHSENVSEMNALLMSAFPETKTILDPVQQMQRSMEGLQSRAGMRPQDMLPLLTRTARAWQTGRPRLRTLRYADRSLTVEVTAPDTQTLEGFQRALQANGLQAEITASTPRAGEIDGRVRIQVPANAPSAKP